MIRGVPTGFRGSCRLFREGSAIGTYSSEWSPEEDASGSTLQPTLWSQILRAKDPKDPHRVVALLRLASSYAAALYAYARRLPAAPAEAERAVGGFFDHIRAQKLGFGPRAHRERLRSFLYYCFQDYVGQAGLVDLKPARPSGIDVGELESWLSSEFDPESSAEQTFRRAWARCILANSCAGLKTELTVRYGRRAADVVIAEVTPAGAKPFTPELGEKLEMTPSEALEMIRSARRRLRELILLTIRETVSSSADVEVEFWDLFKSA
jgi:hypothetical protein